MLLKRTLIVGLALLGLPITTAVSGDTQSPRAVVVTASAYSSTSKQCDTNPFITASGDSVRRGVLAVSRDLLLSGFHFGSKVILVGVSADTFFVRDVMHSRWRQRVDVWLPTVEAAIDFGLVKGLLIKLEE